MKDLKFEIEQLRQENLNNLVQIVVIDATCLLVSAIVSSLPFMGNNLYQFTPLISVVALFYTIFALNRILFEGKLLKSLLLSYKKINI